jgi:REP element-mobilizing transposase RayT
MGGIAREHGMTALAVGGADDHIHMLLSLPSSMPVAKAIREIKSASSRAFSIGKSQAPATLAYIASQPEHHRKHDFQAEFIAFLKKNRVEYDPRYVWG